ncbi:MAG: hypothetical protein QXL76_01030 [Candidatus Rehaiarchaeum fermentans]|nr:ATP-binding protein [Candidatus Rehaiarchaeum fermentans]
MINNPFISIVPVKGENLVDREKEIAELSMLIYNALNKEIGPIIIKGYPGVGKTSIILHLISTLDKNVNVIYRYLDSDTLEYLSSLKLEDNRKYLIIIDDINNEDGFTKEKIASFHSLIKNLVKKCAVILIDNRKKDISTEVSFENLKVMEIKGLSYEDLKKVIINRLNTIRNRPSNDISPFSEKEIEEVYKKSGGNPRFALLILATLFDEKISHEEKIRNGS